MKKITHHVGFVHGHSPEGEKRDVFVAHAIKDSVKVNTALLYMAPLSA
jgi:plasmid stability protein